MNSVVFPIARRHVAIARICLVACLAVVTMCAAVPAVALDGFLWPIEASRSISSSFGEPRTGRFHYGIDFRSDGAVGKPVYALGDGYVSRMSTSSGGYGRALYLTLDSGEIVVYGHLSRFMPEVEERLFRLRIVARSSDVQWWPQKDEVRVKRGQVVAWSGESGSWGAPHLHLELRNGNNEPLNPLNYGLTLPDTMPPLLPRLVFIPLDATGTVDGVPSPRWIEFSGDDPAPVRLGGNVGVAVSVWDRVNGSTNQVGVYRISLAVDSTRVFEKQYDRLSYDINGSGGLDYLNGAYHGGSGTVSVLFRRTGNACDFYTGEGILCGDRGSAGVSVLTVTAEDYAGNRIVRTVPSVLAPPPSLTFCGLTPDGTFRIAGAYPPGLASVEVTSETGDTSVTSVVPVSGPRCDIRIDRPDGMVTIRLTGADGALSLPVRLRVSPESAADCPDITIEPSLFHDRAVIRVRISAPLGCLPQVTATCNNTAVSGIRPVVPAGDGAWITVVPLGETGPGVLTVTAFALAPDGVLVERTEAFPMMLLDDGVPAVMTAPEGDMTVSVPADALYRPAPATLEPVPVRAGGELAPLSGGWRFVLGDETYKGPMRASVTIPDSLPRTAGLYERNGAADGDGGWRFLGADRVAGTMTASFSGNGVIAILNDTVPPQVTPRSPRSGATVTTARPTLSATVLDEGSGLAGPDNIVMSIDGIPVYGEYDPLRHTITYTLHDALKSGNHTVRVTVTDNAGNERTREWTFTVSG